MSKLTQICLPIIILIVWLFPVSNEFNTLNDDMVRRCYLLSLAVLIFTYIYERQINKQQIIIASIILLTLLISTIMFFSANRDKAHIAYGYLMNYIPFCVLVNIRIKKLNKSKILDFLFVAICILLITVGILTILDNNFIEQLLKTNYVIHYPHIYVVMWASHKTVTFFGTHSIACYIYFMIWWLLDYRMQVRKGILNYILIAGILFNIVMCLSVSAVLCIGLIVVYYYGKLIKKATIKSIISSVVLSVIVCIGILLNYEKIINILGSSQNGILGRYGSTGNLIDSLHYAFTNVIPIGICDVDQLWLTDGGYYINFLRGGIILVLFFYIALYKFLKMNIEDCVKRRFLYIGLLLFETGYQFTMSMRFFMIMLFLVVYYRYLLNEEKTKNSCKNITKNTLAK